MHYLVNNLYATTKYLFKIDQFDLITNIQIHQISNQLQSNINQTRETQQGFYINPSLSIVWKINEKNNIKTIYTYQTTNATIKDVLYNFINTGFKEFEKGTGELNQLNASKILLQYSLGNWSDKFFAQVNLMYIKDFDFFSTNSIITQNYTQLQKLLVKDKQSLNYSSTIDRYINKISNNINIHFLGTSSTYKNITNNSGLITITNNTIKYGIIVRSLFSSLFNYNIGSTWTSSKIVSNTNRNSFSTNNTYIDLSLTFSKKINVQFQTESYFFRNSNNGNNQYYFMDIRSQYIIKPNKLTLRVAATNLFNVDVFRDYSVTEVSTTSNEYRLQSRYFLISAEFRF